jgi:hypothetical protein
MRYFLLAVFFGVLLGLAVKADDKGRPSSPQGHVVVKPAAELRRLATPATTPTPAPAFAPRPGHHWRYHPQYGTWVLVPVSVYPQQIALPVTYQLPVQVSVYQAAAPACQLMCPHCGQPITIELK